MDLPTIPTYGAPPVTHQQRNLFPVVPHGSQEHYRSIIQAQPKLFGVVQIVLLSLQLALGAIVTSALEYDAYVTAHSGINYWGSLIVSIQENAQDASME
ncbi:hypothetical protein GDO81_026369 [Engystomops pustulosus]|uniref:Uncharacterized protein n=1 Tax=Engystomops pustulosus TaxID=76066 RepID=A0AAV6YQY2_ENGPU|nr:hypothetical protein GDO81_026369 [Engystomops pustulosus]